MRSYGLFILSLLVIAGNAGCIKDSTSRGRYPTVRVEVEPLTAYYQPRTAVIASGDTIESVCRQLAGSEWILWRDALLTKLGARDLRPGMIFDGQCNSAGTLQKLKVKLDRRAELHLDLQGPGVSVTRTEREIISRELQLEGSITSSLFGAVEEAGGKPELAVRLAEIFQWDIDFLRDIRAGDSFVVLVDEQSVGDEFFGYGTIYAARFTNQGRSLDAIAFPDADGRIGFYDLEGRPLRKQFLRSPMKLSRITSRFSMRRFHPVLKRSMPHYGIDYGAPVGTPAHVTADGVVTFAGRNGGAGNMVRVRHPNGYETNYLHLRRYGKGVKKGTRVVQGQIIGYVGSTGLSTGPHLDYRVKLNGSWINPLSISSPAVKPLEKEQLRRFLAHAIGVVTILAGGDPPTGVMC